VLIKAPDRREAVLADYLRATPTAIWPAVRAATHGGQANPAGSRVPTELRYAIVYTLRDGAIVRGREYADLQQALEAVGLEE
jgi:ketosteroid isomerase-like protein